MNATQNVVENKLTPISATQDKGAPVATFTAQTAIEIFGEYKAAIFSAEGKIVGALQHFMRASAKADAKETALALTGMVESTRLTVDGKRTDGDDTDMARKFQSMARAVYGAVRFGGMSIKIVENATNSQKLYDEAREVLKVHGVDWQGIDTADREARNARKAEARAVKETAEEEGVNPLTLTVEQFQELKGKAAKRLADKQAKEKLDSMEKRAGKIVDDLIKSYGIDDAETVLKRALEVLAAKVIGAVA